jgi:beta-glucanase (GH16 family)
MKLYKLSVVPLVFLASFFAGCEIEAVQTAPDRSYSLVWSDEFNGDAGMQPDAAKWTYDIGTGSNGWGNNELQSYTSDTNNISFDGEGNLVIKAVKESDGSYTSARIKTEGLLAQQYGKIEARIKTPTGSGIWPAFWMLGANIDEVGWPQCGEIDIMEQNGQYSNVTHGSLHGPGYSAAEAYTSSYTLMNSRFDTDFHTYSVEWGEGFIDFFVDGYLYKQAKPSDVSGEWVYDQPFFLILNLAIGGNFVGPVKDGTPFPSTMHIDYVRVYSEN